MLIEKLRDAISFLGKQRAGFTVSYSTGGARKRAVDITYILSFCLLPCLRILNSFYMPACWQGVVVPTFNHNTRGWERISEFKVNLIH